MPRRHFQLTKVRPGEWLLPSNDAAVIWRLVNGEGGWQLYRRPMFANDDELYAEDWASLDGWEMVGPLHRTRNAAIDHAMDVDASVEGMLPPREYDVVDGRLVQR